MKACLWLMVLSAPLLAIPEPTQWPEGAGKKPLQQACLICHSGDIIASQRLTRELWEKTLHKMVKWGAPLPSSDTRALLDYLTQHFGPDVPPAPARRMAIPSAR